MSLFFKLSFLGATATSAGATFLFISTKIFISDLKKVRRMDIFNSADWQTLKAKDQD
jgi:hypothetical protein